MAPEEFRVDEDEDEGPPPPEEDDGPPPAPKAQEENGVARTRRAPKRRARGVAAQHASAPPRDEKDAWPKELEFLWPSILTWLETQGRSAADARVHVWRLTPGALPCSLDPKIHGDQIFGEDQGEAIKDYVINHFHARGKGGPNDYHCRFYTKEGAWIAQSSTFHLDDIETVENRRRSMTEQSAPQGYGRPQPPPRGYQPAPSYQPYQQAPLYQPPQPYQPYPQQHRDVERLQNELERERERAAFERGRSEEILSAMREGRQPNLDYYPPSPPAQQAMTPEGIAAAMIVALRAAGLTPPVAPVGVAAPASPPPVAPPVAAPTAASGIGAQMQQTFEGLAAAFMQTTMKRMASNMFQTMAGEPQSSEGTAAIVEPEKPESDLPFTTSPIPEAAWPDGRPVIFAGRKDNGKIDLLGSLMANPYVAEQGMKIVSAVSEVAKDFVAKASAGGATHVVGGIPRGAIPAGVGAPWATPAGGEREPI